MEFTVDESADALRARLRSFLEANHPGRPAKGEVARTEWMNAWACCLADNGFAGPAWPKEWGGMELSLNEQIAYHEEMTRLSLPPAPAPGLGLIGTIINRFGTPEQRQEYLPGMIRNEKAWCQGFSEPGSGSDLASLSTRAMRDGDVYVVDGQKVWTSHAHEADLMFTLTRTGTVESRQRGITAMVIDMRLPGIEVRTMKDMAGDTRFCEVFLTDVRVPVENVIGQENDGWTVGRTTLGFERSTNNTSRDMRYRRVIDELIELAKARGRSGEHEVRQDLARLETSVRLLHMGSLRVLSKVVAGQAPGPESSVQRLVHTQFEKQVHEFALDLLGADGMLSPTEPLSPQNGRWAWGFLRTRASTIGGGTAEVQRNIVGEKILGLPHEPAPGGFVP